MIPILGPIISGIFEIGKSYMQRKAAESQAVHEAKMERVKQDGKWEEIMAEGSLSSWKDEYLTIIFTTPFILLWISALFDLPELADRVDRAFTIVQTVVPAEYWWVMGAIVAASFGIRTLADLFANIGKK